MAKVKVTKFNFSKETLERAKAQSDFLSAVVKFAEKEINSIPFAQDLWIDTDKVIAASEIIHPKEGSANPDVFTIYFSAGEDVKPWHVLATDYDAFMKAWRGDDPQHQPQPQQPDDPLAQLPQEMVQMITDMVNSYIGRFDAMYWQRQRVEIVKTLMNRLDVATFDPIAICELADKYIQMLKNYE